MDTTLERLMRIIRLFPILAVAASVALSSCSGSSSDKSENDADKADVTEETVDKTSESPAVTIIKGDGQIPTSEGKLIVLDFNATWCGPCRQFAPNFESIADKYRGKASFYSVDVDQNPRLATRFNITSIPTVVYIQPDGTTSSTTGYMDASEFDTVIATMLN